MVDTARDPSFLHDEEGNKTHVLLPIDVYEELLEVIEDVCLLRAIQEADKGEVLTLEQALAALAE